MSALFNVLFPLDYAAIVNVSTCSDEEYEAYKEWKFSNNIKVEFWQGSLYFIREEDAIIFKLKFNL